MKNVYPNLKELTQKEYMENSKKAHDAENINSKILSIGELKNMIKAIKTNNSVYNKRIPACACGKFDFDGALVKHAHIGYFDFERIER